MPSGKTKESVSVNARIGRDLFVLLERTCAEMGQSKTVAVERAIVAYCTEMNRQSGDDDKKDGDQ